MKQKIASHFARKAVGLPRAIRDAVGKSDLSCLTVCHHIQRVDVHICETAWSQSSSASQVCKSNVKQLMTDVCLILPKRLVCDDVDPYGHAVAGSQGCVCQDTRVKTLHEEHAPNPATLQHLLLVSCTKSMLSWSTTLYSHSCRQLSSGAGRETSTSATGRWGRSP